LIQIFIIILSFNADGSGLNMLGKMLMAIRNERPQPAVNDEQDRKRISYFASLANQPGFLHYSIF